MTALERARELVKSVPRDIALVYIDCDAVHHRPADRHSGTECPAATRAIQAQMDSERLAAIAAAGLALALDIDNLRTDMLANREMLAAKGMSYEFPQWILARLDGITASHDAALAAALGGGA